MRLIFAICFSPFNDKFGILILNRNKKIFYNCFNFYSYAVVASDRSCVFKKFPARVRKNKNAQSIFNIFNVVFTLLI